MDKKTKILRILLSIGIVIVLTIFLWGLAPFIKNLATTEGQIAFKEKIDSMGLGGIFLLFGLQILQILLVIFVLILNIILNIMLEKMQFLMFVILNLLRVSLMN